MMVAQLLRNPRFLILTLTSIIVFGSSGFLTRKSREDPTSQVRWGYVTTQLPGATPMEVESLLSDPIEQVMREADSVRSIESVSLRGVSLVFIRLADEIANAGESWAKLQDKLNEAAERLPERASDPILVDERRWGAHTKIIALCQKSDRDVPVGVLARWAKELNNRLSFVPGTKFTESFGVPKEEVLVDLHEETLAATRLTVGSVAERIRVRESSGSDALSQAGSEMMPVSSSGNIDTIDSLRELLVRSGDDGQHIQLGDLATIRRGELQPRSESVFVEGRRAAVIAARMDDRYGIAPWTQRQRVVLDELSQLLPEELELKEIFSQKKYTDRRAGILYKNLGAGMLCVVVVVCLMMGWRAAIPICSALPLTLFVVFFFMIPFGIALHQMSIAGLILALGMLIDNPIIVVDDIQRRMDDGVGGLDAATNCVRHLVKPLLGSNVTTILGFTPILLIGGPTGEFMEQLGWSVIASLSASLALSLTVIPAIAALVLRARPSGGAARSKVGRRSNRSIAHRCFRWFVGLSARYPRSLIVCSLLLSGSGFIAVQKLPEQFFPAAERDHFHFSVRLPTHVAISETERFAYRAREVLLQHEEIESVTLFVGRSAPKLHYSMVAFEDNRSNFAQGIVQLKGDRVPVEFVRHLQTELDEKIPAAQCVVTLIEQGPPSPAPIEFRIYGPSIARLQELGELARMSLMQVPGVIQTRSSLVGGVPNLSINIVQSEVEEAGLSNEAIGWQIRDAVEGVSVATMQEGVEEIPIRVRLSGSRENSPERILSMPIVLGEQSRRLTSLDSVAKWSVDNQLFSVYRRNASRCNIVYAYVQAESLPIEIEKEFHKLWVASNPRMPSGYSYDFGGVSLERNSAVGNLFAYLAIVGMLMITVLVFTLGSFRSASIIVAVAALSIGIGFLSLWIFNFPVGITAIIGISGLLGLAVNDSIVVVNDCQATSHRASDVESVVFESARHVLATSVTTVVGVLPLVLHGGSFFPPMMVVIGGGVVGATILALGFAPACFVLINCRDSREA